MKLSATSQAPHSVPGAFVSPYPPVTLQHAFECILASLIILQRFSLLQMLELTQEAIATLRDLLLDIGRQSARDGLDHRRCVAQQRDTCMQYCRKIKTNLIMFEAARAKRHSINLKPERGVAAKTQAALSHLGASFEVSLNDATSPTSMGQQIEAILPEELAYLINCFSLCMVLLSHQLEISYQLNRIFPLDDSGKVCEMPYGEQMEENSQTANTAPVNPWLVEIEA